MMIPGSLDIQIVFFLESGTEAYDDLVLSDGYFLCQKIGGGHIIVNAYFCGGAGFQAYGDRILSFLCLQMGVQERKE